jgi:hypothetical protein
VEDWSCKRQLNVSKGPQKLELIGNGFSEKEHCGSLKGHEIRI